MEKVLALLLLVSDPIQFQEQASGFLHCQSVEQLQRIVSVVDNEELDRDQALAKERGCVIQKGQATVRITVIDVYATKKSEYLVVRFNFSPKGKARYGFYTKRPATNI